MFFAENWAYVGQPYDHIGWAKWMPFVSIDSSHPRTTLWNFGENCSAFDGGWKTQFFWFGHFLIFFFQKKIIFLLHSYLNQSQINGVAWMGLNFYDYLDFQKIRGGYRIMKHTVLLSTLLSGINVLLGFFLKPTIFFLHKLIKWAFLQISKGISLFRGTSILDYRVEYFKLEFEHV